MKKIFITGGSGYVGSMLVPVLLEKGYSVTVADLLIYGNTLSPHNKLSINKVDIRNLKALKKIIPGHDIFIHLACISNDPSFELNPDLGKTINFDCFEPIVKLCRYSGIKRFVFASSSSVYGIKNVQDVHEEMSLKPLTDYSRFKAECEDILQKYNNKNFVTTTIRPATVCGYSTRQRMDVVVNLLTNLAYNKKEISVFGGEQLRPNIHISDMVNAYIKVIQSEEKLISGEVFNAGYENKSVNEIAKIVKKIIGKNVTILKKHSDDNRSYHISSNKIKKILGFKSLFTIEDAVNDMKNAFEKNKLINPLTNSNYFNIKKMQEIKLK